MVGDPNMATLHRLPGHVSTVPYWRSTSLARRSTLSGTPLLAVRYRSYLPGDATGPLSRSAFAGIARDLKPIKMTDVVRAIERPAGA
jgi:hypothetical protein